MASRYGPLRYGADGARLGRGEARAGEPVFDREGLRREGGGEEIRWGTIERIVDALPGTDRVRDRR
ncbi:hypothetical protein [Kitasatospora purpeofusca]|uniref:hypothetical protein n=1 Tax=Kitasatospora purpeofusca TaxID=67352 RepID=UPI003F4AA249